MARFLTIIISCWVLVVLKAQGQELTFISSLVEEGIRQHLNISEGEQISFQQLDTITTLNLSKRGITDIHDLMLMPKLRSLDLSDNQVDNLRPLAVLDSLEWVDLSYNNLKGINELYYSSAKNLTIIVSFNYISDFSLFASLSTCNFTLEGTGLQYSENPLRFEVNSLYSDINEDEQPVVTYRGYTNMAGTTDLKYGSSTVSAQLDGNTYQVALTEGIAETTQVTISNGEVGEETYVVPVVYFQVEPGQTIVLETGLPEDYELSYAIATVGKVEIVGNVMHYTAPDRVLPDVINFCYYKDYSLKGYSRFYINREKVASEPITIGKSGKASYCGDKSLDFSFSDEVKAYIATGFDKDEGTIWLTRVKDVPAGVPVLIKGEANKTYDVPVTDSQNSYYTNMFVGNTSGEKIQIQETDGDMVNYYLSGDGTFKSVNKSANIGNNKCYLQLPGTFEAAATGAAQTVKIGSIGKASFAAPVDLDFTNVSGLKAFTATGYDKSTKTIWLTRVMKVQKGEGVLLKGDPNSYEIPSAAVQSSYENMFVGNTSGNEIQVLETSEDGSQTNYYLKGDGSFVSVNGYVNIKNNKCYLALPTSMVAVSSTRSAEDDYKFEEPEVIKLPIDFKSIGSEGDGTTSIREVKSGEAKSDEWYTLQGQRVAKPGKGLYIRNGKKVVIK